MKHIILALALVIVANNVKADICEKYGQAVGLAAAVHGFGGTKEVAIKEIKKRLGLTTNQGSSNIVNSVFDHPENYNADPVQAGRDSMAECSAFISGAK